MKATPYRVRKARQIAELVHKAGRIAAYRDIAAPLKMTQQPTKVSLYLLAYAKKHFGIDYQFTRVGKKTFFKAWSAKGIDYSQDNVYDAIGRSALKPVEPVKVENPIEAGLRLIAKGLRENIEAEVKAEYEAKIKKIESEYRQKTNELEAQTSQRVEKSYLSKIFGT